ncbi:hypothetical protein Scani_00900 [Streptomyces caniferus]|uniref:Serine/threonine protein phosphatase n=1 Tax=Streptomyces caniferus TaxID=285557 RepID=A0A640RZF9_9ACTN|nr:hypothetical protein Scani_00900 [Streptomyces caniferus]
MTAPRSMAGPPPRPADGSADARPSPDDPAEPPRAARRESRPAPPQMMWHQGRPGLQSLVVWTERVPGRGEDAEPFVAHHFGAQQGMLAVFDGSGGAGSSPAWQAPDGETRTGAWVGSRVARLAADCWFHDVVERGQADTPEQLTQYLKYFLSKAPQRRSKIVGTMRRRLPTTLAAVQYQMREQHSIECQALWAGDSRAYTLQPGAGLRVLTRDHTQESDALELLRSDPPMTNSICADREFVVDVQRRSFQLPCVFLAATDGFFGYVHTPAVFEYVLLSTLMQADNELEWADLIRREVQGYTADDASMALIALGYQDVRHLRGAFADRYVTVRDRYVHGRPQGTDLTERIRGWQDDTWRSYRADYETFLPPLPEEQA